MEQENLGTADRDIMKVPIRPMRSGHTIYHDLVIKAPLERVFRAVSEPEELCSWWPLRCSGNPGLGKEFNFYFGEEYDWYGKVVTYLHNKAFHVKMTRSEPDWDPTTFGFDLQGREDGVLLQFWHMGWSEVNAHYRTASFCWAMLLNGLKNYLEKGIVIPFALRS